MTAYTPASTREDRGGVAHTYKFPNGRGASVIRHAESYGGTAGLWELAVLNTAGRLDYTTPITDDVLGWLTWDEVQTHLAAIADLEAPEKLT